MSDGYVLVVDDHPDVRKLVCDVLDVMGHEAREATNGQEALDIITEAEPKLIVLDLMMPVMDGFTTLKRLQERRKDTTMFPVILLSAIAEDPDSMMRLPGVKGVLRKGGFTVSQLRKVMSDVMADN